MTVTTTGERMIPVEINENTSVTSTAPAPEDVRLFLSKRAEAADVYDRAVQRLASGDSLTFDARDVLNLHD